MEKGEGQKIEKTEILFGSEIFREMTFSEKISFFSSSDLAKTPNSDICFCVCPYFCICVFLVFPCVIVFVFQVYLCISIIFRLHLLLTLLLSSPAGIYRQTLAQLAAPFINQLQPGPLNMKKLSSYFDFSIYIYIYWD